jgi:hypothetical protein
VLREESALAIDLLGAVVGGDAGQLRQRDAFAGGRKQAHILDGLARIAILLLIAQRHVVARLALLHLRERVGAHGGLHGILDVGHVDAPARGGGAVHGELRLGWPTMRKMPRSSMPLNGGHLGLNFVQPSVPGCADRRRKA